MNSNFRNITIQDFLALIVSLGVFSLVLCKYTVPDQIWSGWMVILTFFFNKPASNGNSTTTTVSQISTEPIKPIITKIEPIVEAPKP